MKIIYAIHCRYDCLRLVSKHRFGFKNSTRVSKYSRGYTVIERYFNGLFTTGNAIVHRTIARVDAVDVVGMEL